MTSQGCTTCLPLWPWHTWWSLFLGLGLFKTWLDFGVALDFCPQILSVSALYYSELRCPMLLSIHTFLPSFPVSRQPGVQHLKFSSKGQDCGPPLSHHLPGSKSSLNSPDPNLPFPMPRPNPDRWVSAEHAQGAS